MGTLILVLGGTRSGKSSFAEELAVQSGHPVCYVATARALDDEMRDRIRKHQERRPAHWCTLEVDRHVGEAIRATAHSDEVVLIDCLTLLISNVILEQGEDVSLEAAEPHVKAEVDAVLAFARTHTAPTILVSNEVGLGGVPLYPLGRVYQDLLGWANQEVAAEAGLVYWVVAGLPIEIKRLLTSPNPFGAGECVD